MTCELVSPVIVSVLFHPGTPDLPPIPIGDGYPAAFSRYVSAI